MLANLFLLCWVVPAVICTFRYADLLVRTNAPGNWSAFAGLVSFFGALLALFLLSGIVDPNPY
jgi:hypothetical protein